MNYEMMTIFNQITSFIPWYEFDKCVNKYNGNYKTKTFKCKYHFLSILFAQLTSRNSLRDYDRLYNTELNKAFFITRIHPTSTKVRRIYSNKINKENNKHYILNKDDSIKGRIIYDQIIIPNCNQNFIFTSSQFLHIFC